MSGLKEQLCNLCRQYLDKNISDIETAIADRRQAITAETKSSMGDKYETTREMLQQEINMNMQRLNEAHANLAILNSIDPQAESSVVAVGSIVVTDTACYYISVSAGAYVVEGKKYYTVSAFSPIGMLLKGKLAGDHIVLNGKEYKLRQVL